MIPLRIVTIISLFFLFLIPSVNARETNYDGYFWNETDRDIKELIIGAVFWGQQAAYDKIFLKSIMGEVESNSKADCSKAIRGLLKSLQEKQKSIEIAQVIQNMDRFYSIPDNKPLKLKWAFLEAMLRMKGAPEREIKTFIEEVRKSPRK